MDDLLKNLKHKVTSVSGNPNFIHHKWFVKYHLEILEKIALELCDKYKDADRNLVLILVWVHDYGKILGIKDDLETIIKETNNLMAELGFDEDITNKTLDYLKVFESKMSVDLKTAPIEVKIVSSADGASHMIGPFYALWWYENAGKGVEELMDGNRHKAKKDWERKIVLPEVKETFKERNKFVLESSGVFPEKYLP